MCYLSFWRVYAREQQACNNDLAAGASVNLRRRAQGTAEYTHKLGSDRRACDTLNRQTSEVRNVGAGGHAAGVRDGHPRWPVWSQWEDLLEYVSPQSKC